MTLFRRITPASRRAGEPWPEMPPRPPLYQRAADPGLKGAWITQAPLDPEFDPSGAGPIKIKPRSDENGVSA